MSHRRDRRQPRSTIGALTIVVAIPDGDGFSASDRDRARIYGLQLLGMLRSLDSGHRLTLFSPHPANLAEVSPSPPTRRIAPGTK